MPTGGGACPRCGSVEWTEWGIDWEAKKNG